MIDRVLFFLLVPTLVGVLPLFVLRRFSRLAPLIAGPALAAAVAFAIVLYDLQFSTSHIVFPDRYRCGLSLLAEFGVIGSVTLFNAELSLGLILLGRRVFK